MAMTEDTCIYDAKDSSIVISHDPGVQGLCMQIFEALFDLVIPS